MGTIFEAIEDSKLNYVAGTRVSPFHGDVSRLEAAAVVGGCVCRGKCGTHTGPCSMKAATKGGTTKMCKACSMAMSAKKKK